jgi:hypothetical protein
VPQFRTKDPAAPEEDIMHPMFKELFIDTDADAPVTGDDRRRRMRRSRRARSAMIIRPAARYRENRLRP